MEQNMPAPEPIRIPEYVTLPADDYRELYVASLPHVPATTGDRVNQAAQTTLVFVGFGALLAGGAWTVAKVTDFIEERRFSREMRKLEKEKERRS